MYDKPHWAVVSLDFRYPKRLTSDSEMAFSWNRRKADDAYLTGLPEVGVHVFPL